MALALSSPDEIEENSITEESFRCRLSVAEGQALNIIKGDLADWLKELLGIEISSETFLSVLDNGVHLCQLASVFQKQATSLRKEGRKLPFELPSKKVKFFESAQKESFYARDNASNFISWCKALGIEDTVMFESDGLVLHKNEKNVILCLMEVARRAVRLDLPAPNLIRLEIEMDRESIAEDADVFDEEDKKLTSKSVDPKLSPDNPNLDNKPLSPVEDQPSTNSTSSGVGSSSDVPRTSRESSSGSDNSPPRKKVRKFMSKMDHDVIHMCSECKCKEKLTVNCVKSGKFELIVHNKKIVIFVRTSPVGSHGQLYKVLKETIMVRVGGGWDTLNHFLLKHDPCRIALLNHSKDVKDVILRQMKK